VNKDRETVIIIRKKKGHGHGHHGGAWKVAFADFMTSMMALFLVLWLVTQSSDVRAAIAGYFQDPMGRASEFGSSIIPGEGAQSPIPQPVRPEIVSLRKNRLKALADAIEESLRQSIPLDSLAKQIEIAVTDEGLRIQLLEDSSGVFFDPGSAHPRPVGAVLLSIIGRQLGTVPNDVVVDGYTDAAGYGNPQSTYGNWELSVDRANTARRILVSGGLSERQVAQVRGHADRDLRDPTAPRAASNRRVTITMLFAPEDSLARAPGLSDSTLPATAADSALPPVADSLHHLVQAP
jgi:chemotaxis protein MotB